MRFKLVIAVAVLMLSGGVATAREYWKAHGSGSEEVPANDSRGQSQATFKLSKDGESLQYKLNVANLENVLFAHIHLGEVGVNGPVVVFLYGGPTTDGRTQGRLADGSITEAMFVGPLAGQPMSALLDAIRDGRAYVNVHTDALPAGEVRGQID